MNDTSPPQHGLEQMQQLTIYICEGDHVERRPLYLRILEMAKSSGSAGATVLKGLAGYSSSSSAIHTAGFADIERDLPLVIIMVDTTSKIEEMLPHLQEWIAINGGLITVQDLEGHHYLHPNLPPGHRGRR